MCDPKFCKAMLAEVNKQKDTIVKLALLLLSGTTAAKTAYALQVLSDKNNTINFRKEEIASMVGLTRETVSRELGKLKKKKIIEVEQHRIKITNPLELKQTAKQKK